MKKQQYTLEFLLPDSSVSALWEMLSTPEGLAKWFADKVEYTESDTILFEWGVQKQKADIVIFKPQEYIRFHWVGMAHREYFEFSISKNELTGTLSFTITDFALPQDLDDDKQLWESNVGNLRRVLGI
ncbi:MAG: START-like domain-containing protein [Bacteroidota bacterium]|jgi:hypothetical protein